MNPQSTISWISSKRQERNWCGLVTLLLCPWGIGRCRFLVRWPTGSNKMAALKPEVIYKKSAKTTISCIIANKLKWPNFFDNHCVQREVPCCGFMFSVFIMQIQYGGRQTGSSFNFATIVDRRPVPVSNHRFSTTPRRMVLVLCSADNTFYRHFKMLHQKLEMYMNFTGKSKVAVTITMGKMSGVSERIIVSENESATRTIRKW